MIGNIVSVIVGLPLFLLLLGQIIRDGKELYEWAKGEQEKDTEEL